MTEETAPIGHRSVRVRFCPSPTGTPHVGLIRTALFNWAYARHHDGALVFRIEDTDAARDDEASYQQLLEALRWLGLTWDEGVEVGGAYGPYRQSERGELYQDVLAKLREGGHIYRAYSTAQEVQERHKAAGRDPQLGYDNFDRTLTAAQVAEFEAAGRAPVWRFKMPDEDISFTDLVRGPVTFPAGTVPDFVVARADGTPLYPLVNPVDDALMKITHVIRGEDLLSSTPRQIALYAALVSTRVTDFVPEFGHLPLVTGAGNKKLSKRDPQSNLFHHRDAGFVPAGLLNYLALLGWSIAPDRDVFTMAEMVQAFDVAAVSGNAARFDEKKAAAINAEHLRLMSAAELADHMVPYLRSAGLVGQELTAEQSAVLAQVAPLVQTRMQVLGQAPGMVGFLFVSADDFVVSEEAAASLRDEAVEVLRATVAALTPDVAWETAALEEALRAALVDGLGLKPKWAFGPVRVAVSGSKVSPPLFESMEILGREESLRRIQALLDARL